jgi:hypothetical protein
MSPLPASRNKIAVMALMISCAALCAPSARAQWWSHPPADFEDCADLAEKVPTGEARTAALSDCNAKFAGRRKPGGGYTYFDFMQNRSFDIAGPNPTPLEQKQIDEQYAVYLEDQRRSSIAAAFVAKRQQLQQQASLKSDVEKPSPITGSPAKTPLPAGDPRRAKQAACSKQHSFSCDWPKLSESINDLKKALFGTSPGKASKTKQGTSS